MWGCVGSFLRVDHYTLSLVIHVQACKELLFISRSFVRPGSSFGQTREQSAQKFPVRVFNQAFSFC